MKQKLKDLGVWFDISNGWHKQIEMPKDEHGNNLPWYDEESKHLKLKNNSYVFKELMKEISKNITGLKSNILKKDEEITLGRKAACFCYGKYGFRDTKSKDFKKLGITVILLGPGSSYAYAGNYVPIDNKYDVIITFRSKKTYGELTDRLIKQCNKLNINYYVEIYNAKDGNYH